MDSRTAAGSPRTAGNLDLDRFRLRAFLAGLGEDELEIRPERIDLADVAQALEGNQKAVWFRTAGPEGAELVGNVAGSRSRLARAFGVTPQDLLPEILRRLRSKPEIVEVSAPEAPVQQVVLTGDDADLTTLPVHLQHGEDGAPYISAGDRLRRSIPDTGRPMSAAPHHAARPRAAGIDLVAPSDLRAIYLRRRGSGEQTAGGLCGRRASDRFHGRRSMRLADGRAWRARRRCAARRCRWSNASPTTSTCRPTPNTCWRAISTQRGHVEPEGPYGEFLGYYGVVKRNPVFHLTAITHRKDALFQTVDHRRQPPGAHRHRAAHHGADRSCWSGARSKPRCASRSRFMPRRRAAACTTCASRIRQRVPGEARNAIAGGVRLHGQGQARVRGRSRHRRVLRRADGLGAGDALPGRPRPDRRRAACARCRSIRRSTNHASAPRRATT